MDRSPLIWILKKTPNQVGNEGLQTPKEQTKRNEKNDCHENLQNQTKRASQRQHQIGQNFTEKKDIHVSISK